MLSADLAGIPVARSPSFTGTATLVRFIVRRDGVRMLAWIGGIALLTVLTVASIKGLYPTQADLDHAAAATKGNAAAIAFNGPAVGLDTVGGQVAFNLGAFGLVVVGLMSLLMVGRLTRGEEEAGRLEMLRALPVGSRAPTVAALLVVAGMDGVVGGVVSMSLVAAGLPVNGSIVFGVCFMLVGLLFSAIAMAAAEVTENTRVVYGSAGAVLGAAFVVRAIGDIGSGTISWLSPIGWAQKTRPFAGDVWWPFIVVAGATAVVAAVAARAAARRDLGGGLVAPRPGRAAAARTLGSPLGLALRLQRAGILAWGLGVIVMAVAYGTIAPTIDDFIGHNKALADMFAAGGGNLTDAYFATSVQIVALLAAGFAIQATLRIRTEEAALRAESLLATPISRFRWAMSHLTIAVVGSVGLLLATGATMGLSYAAAGSDVGKTGPLVLAALVYGPAIGFLIGFAVALVGVAPRATIAAWAALVACFVIGMLGQLLRLSQWVRDVSPFEHVPRLPAADMRLVPIAVLLVAAATLCTVGLVALRSRDIG